MNTGGRVGITWVAPLQFLDALYLFLVDMCHRQARDFAFLENIDCTPIGDARNCESRNCRERRAIIQAGTEFLSGSRQKLRTRLFCTLD